MAGQYVCNFWYRVKTVPSGCLMQNLHNPTVHSPTPRLADDRNNIEIVGGILLCAYS